MHDTIDYIITNSINNLLSVRPQCLMRRKYTLRTFQFSYFPYNFPSSLSYGNLCLGHGIIPINYGKLNKKLTISIQ